MCLRPPAPRISLWEWLQGAGANPDSSAADAALTLLHPLLWAPHTPFIPFHQGSVCVCVCSFISSAPVLISCNKWLCLGVCVCVCVCVSLWILHSVQVQIWSFLWLQRSGVVGSWGSGESNWCGRGSRLDEACDITGNWRSQWHQSGSASARQVVRSRH